MKLHNIDLLDYRSHISHALTATLWPLLLTIPYAKFYSLIHFKFSMPVFLATSYSIRSRFNPARVAMATGTMPRLDSDSNYPKFVIDLVKLSMVDCVQLG